VLWVGRLERKVTKTGKFIKDYEPMATVIILELRLQPNATGGDGILGDGSGDGSESIAR